MSSTPVLCNGDLSEVTISVSGGTAPYSGIGTVSSSDVALIITGVIDGPLSGGVPKAVELYAVSDIGDLSEYGLGSANNGSGTDGQEFTFPSISVNQGNISMLVQIHVVSLDLRTFLGLPPITTLLLYRLMEMMRLNYLKME